MKSEHHITTHWSAGEDLHPWAHTEHRAEARGPPGPVGMTAGQQTGHHRMGLAPSGVCEYALETPVSQHGKSTTPAGA